MQRLLITGGTGYLGRELVRQALAQGLAVTATWHTTPLPAESPPGLNWLPLDVRSEEQVEAVVAAAQPDVIIHTAYRQSEPDLHATTAMGAHHVAHAAHHHTSRLIHLSSDVIFRGERQGSYSEDDPPDPVTAYGSAKAEAEQLVARACPAAVSVRTSLIYGFHPIDRHTRLALDIADGASEVRLFTDEYRCPIFVGDLATALLELAPLPYQGVLHIAGADCVSRHEFGVLLAQAHGRDGSRLPAGLSSESSTVRPRNCALAIQRAQQMLSTPQRGVREVLATGKAAPPGAETKQRNQFVYTDKTRRQQENRDYE